MDDNATDEEIWITQSSLSKTCIHKHLAESTMSEDQFSSISETLVALNKADACEVTTRVTDSVLAERIDDRVPKATQSSMNWAVGVWEKWARERNPTCVNWSQDKFGQVGTDIALLPKDELNYWLAKFVLEVQKKESGQVYCRNTLNQMVCGLQRFIRDNGRPELNFFEQAQFKLFRDSLDAEMKRLILLGVGVVIKEAEALTMDEEDILWPKNFLGRCNSRALLNSMVFLLGRCFALRDGKEHRGLAFKKLTLFEGENSARAKLCYCFLGKNPQRRIKRHEIQAKTY